MPNDQAKKRKSVDLPNGAGRRKEKDARNNSGPEPEEVGSTVLPVSPETLPTEPEEITLTVPQMDSLASKIRGLLSSSASEVTACMVYLGSLKLNVEPDVRKRAAAYGMVLSVVLAMQNHATVLDVQQWACLLLCDLAVDHDDALVIDAMVAHGGLRMTVAAMVLFPQESMIQFNGLTFFERALSGHDSPRQVLVHDEGSIQAVLEAIRNHLDDVELLVVACSVFTHVAKEKDCGDLVLQAGGPSALAICAEKHPNNAELRAAVRDALAAII